ncbi:hypothetical protein I7I51_05444 [Histoplasma capsulatum]|uniref:Uncharacterized protein n=1 Tax=Ajellomyces capsulatus TaxID=5037 RepID=A0A8A1M7E3_AJECA|nr:hypothetical protein I7I51_05444 [Histoplasma capsulatum]
MIYAGLKVEGSTFFFSAGPTCTWWFFPPPEVKNNPLTLRMSITPNSSAVYHQQYGVYPQHIPYLCIDVTNRLAQVWLCGRHIPLRRRQTCRRRQKRIVIKERPDRDALQEGQECCPSIREQAEGRTDIPQTDSAYAM